MVEIWKDIIGYEGTYQISNLGRIKSLERILPSDGIRVQSHRKERLLKGNKDRKGYHRISLSVNCVKSKMLSKHRLVAIYFVDNPYNKPEVNHINGIKSDNRAVNLEWVTRSENQYHAYATGLKKPAKSTRGGKYNSRSKPILQIFEDGTIKKWEGIRRAAIGLNLSPGNIGMACKGRHKKCGGFKWEYAEL